jgi:hypothetical protein
MAHGLVKLVGGILQWDSNDGQSRRAALADNDPVRSTYSYAIGGLAVATAATDVAVLELPLAKTNTLIRLRQLQVSGSAGTTNSYVLSIIKRNLLNSGGTRTTPAPVPRDSRLDPADAVLGLYTVNPTINNTVGPIDGGRLTLATSGGNTLDRLNLQYSWLNDMAPVLRNPGESLALNFNGTLPAGALIDISLTWTEEEIT